MAELLTSVVGLVTAAAALLTILEMRRQRASAYKPDLLVEGANLRVLARPGDTPELARIQQSTSGPGFPHSVCLDLFNLGVGAAKRVSARWHFDFQALLEGLSRWRAPTEPWAELRGDRVLQFVNASGPRSTHMLEAQLRSASAFLLPASSRSESHELRLPPAYLESISLALHLFSVAECKPSEGGLRLTIGPQIPPMYVDLEFLDLENGSHRAQFRIEFKLFSLSPGSASSQAGSELGMAFLSVERVIQEGRFQRWRNARQRLPRAAG